MSKNPVLFNKTLVVGIVVQFLGIGCQPVIATTQDEVVKDFNLFTDDADTVKYPLLYVLISYITNIKVNRWLKWVSISAETIDDNLHITNPVIFVYSLWLLMRLTVWDNLWTFLDKNYDLNWDYPP